jgi:serine/threonine protein kinase
VQGRPKLADVGLVAEITPADKENTSVGTPGYMPPAPEPVGTPQADIYGLGMVLYVISTGREAESVSRDFRPSLGGGHEAESFAAQFDYSSRLSSRSRRSLRFRSGNARSAYESGTRVGVNGCCRSPSTEAVGFSRSFIRSGINQSYGPFPYTGLQPMSKRRRAGISIVAIESPSSSRNMFCDFGRLNSSLSKGHVSP